VIVPLDFREKKRVSYLARSFRTGVFQPTLVLIGPLNDINFSHISEFAIETFFRLISDNSDRISDDIFDHLILGSFFSQSRIFIDFLTVAD
jgi:hypothetical protein